MDNAARPFSERVKVVRLTDRQIWIHSRILREVALAIETGKPIRIRRGQRIPLPPQTVLRNLADWLLRIAREQQGEPRIVMAWDYQEEV